MLAAWEHSDVGRVRSLVLCVRGCRARSTGNTSNPQGKHGTAGTSTQGTEQTKSSLQHWGHQTKACSRDRNLKALIKNKAGTRQLTMIWTAYRNLEKVGVFLQGTKCGAYLRAKIM